MSSEGVESKQVVLSLEGENILKEPSKDLRYEKYQCYSNRAYLIVGKKWRHIINLKCLIFLLFLGGKYSNWIDLTEWLVIRGARKIIVAIKKYAMSTTASRR